ncbi:acetyl-coenzyme A synthetase [Cucumis melo var. makuwa]|uniref:acetate--CoA ligase n=1 Tax=Cucumis melo var. makuwa TaxID=1194695 RepID=A0A5D3CTI8_CUCMM|nr:acetyl-coenzyme A synthetase [Cucumis melo var. makuwa]
MISNDVVCRSQTLSLCKTLPLINNINSSFSFRRSSLPIKPFKTRVQLKITSSELKWEKERNETEEKVDINKDNINHNVEEFLLGSEEDEAMVPSQEFCLKAHIPNTQKYMDMYKRSIEEPSEFWSEIASSEFYWKKEWNHNQAFNENLDITKGNINIEVANYPNSGRCWEIVDKYKVSVFFTAPTLIRSLMRDGDQHVRRYSRTSLRVLGSAGEPINPTAWRWFYKVVGDSRCPISDTWWQTETGAAMITPIPGAWPLKPGSATFPFFGVKAVIVDEEGKEIEGEGNGYLCIKGSWPGALRTLYGDHERYETTYFKQFPGYYFTGDGCIRDKDGYFWITGRVDDVLNVSGHRIGTAEVESALVSHSHCAEAAVIGIDHEVKGQSIHAFVTLVEGVPQSEELRESLKQTIRTQIGAFAAPDKIHWANELPKTRSGKILRRVLRKIASKQLDEIGDTSTLADPTVLDQLIAQIDS